MKDFDDNGLKLCRIQGELFKESVDKTDCSSPIFLRRFMYSKVAARMDHEGFLSEAASKDDILDELLEEYHESTYGQIKYDYEEMYWIGYIYRYWCYTNAISSKNLYKKIKPEELKKLYFPYHSMDPGQAVERIKEANGIREEDYITKGVELLRKIKKENQVRDN